MKKLDTYTEELKGWAKHEDLASNLLSAKLYELYKPNTVIDIGCGSGLFLRYFIDNGCKCLGVDGEKTGGFLLESSKFKQVDLRKRQDFGKFDLAICLEVIEHLQPEYEDILMDTITKSADILVFSGAKPGQVGTNHYNCQEKQYWASKLMDRGFTVSDDTLNLLNFIRSKEEFKSCPWFEDNILVAMRNE